MDRLDSMEAFVAVAEAKGFAQAARKLKVSPPTVTRLIASLEQRLSVELFHRTTRAVSLTEHGARYLPKARGIIDAVKDAEASTKAGQAAPSGRFTVTAPLVFGRREVAPLFSRFLARWPAVRGELLLFDRVVNLVEEGIDVAVRIGELDDSSLKVRAVGSTRRVLVASPGYLEKHGRPKKPHDLEAHATIQLTPLSAQHEWRFGDARVALEPCFVTNSADVAIEHAVRGGGLAMVLSYQVSALVEAGRLEVVLGKHEPSPRPIQLVYPAGRTPSANVRAFVDLAAQQRGWVF